MAEQLVWVDPAGNITNLNDPATIMTLPEVVGRLGLMIEHTLDDLAGQPGAILRWSRPAVRRVTLPLVVVGPTATAARARVRALAYALDPTRGIGRLRATAPDGAVRELYAVYEDGLDQAAEEQPGQYRVAVTLVAPDPYWYDATATITTYPFSGTVTPFLKTPFFPLAIGGSAVTLEQTITNPGDVEAWPLWAITGPGTNPVLQNITTGAVLRLQYSISVSDRVLIDTRPVAKSVKNAAGTNLFGLLQAGSTLWSLAPGQNLVRVTLADVTTATSVTVEFTPRWWAP